MKILLMGGSKSGKSMYGQELTRALGGPLYYLATLRAADGQDEAIIERHLREREGWGYETIEQPSDLPACFSRIDPSGTALLDSLTCYLAEEMFGRGFDKKAGERVLAGLRQLGSRVRNVAYVGDYFFGEGIVHDEPVEEYKRQFARICRRLARDCDAVAEMVNGIPLWHKGGDVINALGRGKE